MRWVPAGPALDLGLWHNVFGAYAALVSKAAFMAVGGYGEEEVTLLGEGRGACA